MQNSENTSLHRLTHSGLLARNVGYNLLGQVLPMIVALVSLPIIVRSLGAERFGVLALAWVVIGYVGFFDLGLGRVVTKMVGEQLGRDDESSVPHIFWTGVFYMAMLGLVVSILLYVFSPQLVRSVLKISTEFQAEALLGFRYLALGTTFVIVTVGVRAVLEAYQKFGILNIVRTINGVLLYLAPLLLVPFTQSIDIYVLALVGIRVFILVLYAIICFQQVPILRQRVAFNKSLTANMFKLGGWISVSNIIGPVMVYVDRFLIGVWNSVAAVAYYVTPYEVISKMLLITSSVVRVLFPAFSMSLDADPRKAAGLYSRGIRVLIFMFFPIILGIVIFAFPAMKLWMGEEFALKGSSVMQWLAIGIFMNAPGQIAYAALQAGGRPDITAKIHVIETPIYLFVLFFFLKWFGITGAAMAWSIRLIVETFILFHFAEKLLTSEFPQRAKIKSVLVVLCAVLIGLVYVNMTLLMSILIVVAGLIATILLMAVLLIEKEERRSLAKLLKIRA